MPAAPTNAMTGQFSPPRNRGTRAANEDTPTTSREVGIAWAGLIPTP